MSAFAPTTAVICHSLVALDPDVFDILKGEDYLLIHQCTARAARKTVTRMNTRGRTFLRVDHDESLVFSVRATVLEQTGLGNPHPGRLLSHTALEFANAGALPFQFRMGTYGRLIFGPSAELDPQPGDLPSLSFDVIALFAELDTDEYPATGGGTGTPGSPSQFVEIPAQDAAEILECRNALLLAAFNGVDPFADAAVTATLYAGTPGAGGVALTDPLPLTPWTTFDEDVVSYSTRARNQVAITWLDSAAVPREATQIRIERNGRTIATIVLANPLAIPAYWGIRAPVNALAVQLTWPTDGTATPPAAANRPSRHFLAYTMGGLFAAAFPNGNRYLTASDDDLVAPTDFDSLPAVPATADNWLVEGLKVFPRNITGTITAPGGGWPVELITVRLNGATVVILREYYAAAIAVGETLLLNLGPVLDLETVPAA